MLLKCDWVERNVPNWKSNNGVVTNENKLDLEIVPSLLELKYEEKFKDDNGNVIEIETRGTKTLDGIYFYGKDVERMLDLECITDILNQPTTKYDENIHYKKFIRSCQESQPVTDKKLSKETTYLTYKGLVRMLITRRHPVADKFQDWCFKTLFTVQIGNENEKEKLGTKILNMNIETYRNVFKTHSTVLPSVYLLELGRVKDLKDTFRINDEIYNQNTNSYIYKFGCTEDLDKRISQHNGDYGKLKNVNLQLVKFTMIEQRYKTEAEQNLRQSFNNFNKRLIVKIDKNEKKDDNVNDKNRYELVILNKEELETIFKYYKLIKNEYAGSTTELQNKIEKMKHEAELKSVKAEINNNQIELIKRDIEYVRLDKEKQKADYENELLKKELKIKELEHINKYRELELKMKEMEVQQLKNQLKN